MADRKKRPPLGPGAVGAWTEEELEHPPEVDLTAHPPARQDDDPEALREGIAEANRREVASTEPLEEENADAVPGQNRRGIHPGETGTRRGEEELERGTE